MKQILTLLLLFFSFNFISTAQVFDPIHWSSKATKITEDEYEIIYTANIDEHWHFYSQNQYSDEGPIATEFTFDNPEGDFEILDKTEESESIEIFEDVFQMKVKYFENKAVFKQKIKVLNPNAANFKASVFYQACDNERCLRPTDFEFNTPLSGESELVETATLDENSKLLSEKLKLNISGWEKHQQDDVKSKSNFSIFILGFLGGLLALLTPCVFPMIPLTVSFFTKGASNTQRGMTNSIMYGFFIFLIYFLLSLPFHLLDSLDSEILNNVSTNVPLNILFFLIFIAFAISFFGYYELTLPSSWSNSLDSKANKIGGWIGIFLMALTLAIVSFSCTGPILGGLLGSTALSTGDVATKLSVAMSGFGLALALPFTLFAMFPKWLNSLPKSGGWLNTVKVVLGFIELALALKFLSNADLVKHWGLLKREVFIALWIIIGILMVLYLLGKIKFPHDGPIKKLSFGRISFTILVIAFVVYLIPGLTNTKYANLKLLSGLAPPLSYSLFDHHEEKTIFKDFEEGLAYAKENNKPIMLDFTGWACVNCRKMEEHVWTDEKINNMLRDNFVIISLYVDDRMELPQDEQFQVLRSNGSAKDIKTIGDKWSTFQTVNFNNNSQPYYVLLSPDLEPLNATTAYTPNVDEYYSWLKTGLENFKQL